MENFIFCALLYRFSSFSVLFPSLNFSISTGLLISLVTVMAINSSFESFALDQTQFTLLLQTNLFLSRKNAISVYILSHLVDFGSRMPLRKHYLQSPLSSLRQFLTIKSLLQMMKKIFYFMLKALFVLETFTFSVLDFWLYRKMA